MKLHHKIIVVPITVMLIIFLTSMMGMEFYLKETLREQLVHKLRTFVSFALSSATEGSAKINVITPSQSLLTIAKRISRISSSRITFLNPQGVVLADSALNFSELASVENHLNRSEIILALKIKEGISYRFIPALSQEVVYLAHYDPSSNFIVRASMPMRTAQQAIFNLRWSFLVIILLSIVVVVILGLLAISLIKNSVNDERALQESRIIARTREITLVQTMTTMLNAAYTLDDAAIVLLNIMPKLLPSLSGAIFLLDEKSSLNEVSHWGSDWHQDIATMTKNRWLMQDQNPGKYSRSNEYSFCDDLVHDGEFIGILQLVTKDKIIDVAYQNLIESLAPQLSGALMNIQFKDRLRNQASRDPLTELYNRRFMLESFEQALNRAKRHNLCLAVLMIDLDHFKKFNDNYGHDAGDKVLVMVAEQFKLNLRLEDIACRYGGEEFFILCPDTGVREAPILAEKLRQCIADQQITYKDKLLDKVTLSIGIAIYPNHGTSCNDLLQQADKSLYVAKDQGRNRTVVTINKVSYYQG